MRGFRGFLSGLAVLGLVLAARAQLVPTVEWIQAYDLPNAGPAWAAGFRDLCELPDGGFLLAATVDAGGDSTQHQWWLMRLDRDGLVPGLHIYTPFNPRDDIAALEPADDGNFFLIGQRGTVLKVTGDGDSLYPPELKRAK